MNAANNGLIYDAIIGDNKCRLERIAQISDKSRKFQRNREKWFEEIFHFQLCNMNNNAIKWIDLMRTSPNVAKEFSAKMHFPTSFSCFRNLIVSRRLGKHETRVSERIKRKSDAFYYRATQRTHFNGFLMIHNLLFAGLVNLINGCELKAISK